MEMTLAEIETLLANEGMAPMSMERYDSHEGQTTRKSEDGEYDLTDFVEGDNSPESNAIIEQFMVLGEDFMKDEYALEEGCSGVEEDVAPRKAWGWLKRQ